MRRLAALWLLMALAVPAVLPLLALPSSPSESQLPSCCRRDGKHHCAMTAMLERESQETSVRRQPASCPYRSHTFTLFHGFAIYLPASPAFHAVLVQHLTVRPHPNVSLLLAETRSHLKRGPPLNA